MENRNDVFDVEGKIVVITGGLGQLGRQFSNELLCRKAKLVILDLPAKPDLSWCKERFNDEKFLYYCVDITKRESLEKALESVASCWGTPHAVINCAALDSPPDSSADENGPFESYPVESWDKVMDVNTKGVFLVCQVFGGAMAKAGRGSIVNICSIYGLVSPNQTLYEYRAVRDGKPFFKPVAYSASKSALVNLTRYVATYFAPNNVRVNLISPGGVFNNQDKEFLKQYCSRVPLGRMAREEEYNGAIIFLVSDASSYMTGSNLVIDGGWTAW